MDGSTELLHLAHLLRATADAARDVGDIRPRDKDALDLLAHQAFRIAREMEHMVDAQDDHSTSTAR